MGLVAHTHTRQHNHPSPPRIGGRDDGSLRRPRAGSFLLPACNLYGHLFFLKGAGGGLIGELGARDRPSRRVISSIITIFLFFCNSCVTRMVPCPVVLSSWPPPWDGAMLLAQTACALSRAHRTQKIVRPTREASRWRTCALVAPPTTPRSLLGRPDKPWAEYVIATNSLQLALLTSLFMLSR